MLYVRCLWDNTINGTASITLAFAAKYQFECLHLAAACTVQTYMYIRTCMYSTQRKRERQREGDREKLHSLQFTAKVGVFAHGPGNILHWVYQRIHLHKLLSHTVGTLNFEVQPALHLLWLGIEMEPAVSHCIYLSGSYVVLLCTIQSL